MNKSQNKQPPQHQQPLPMDGFALKPTKPKIGSTNRPIGALNLVEPMNYLYVRIVKAKDLYGGDDHPEYDPFVEVRVGNYRARTKHLEKKSAPEWNHVFAFAKDRVHLPFFEVFVMSKEGEGGGVVKGRVLVDVNETPVRNIPDSPLAPQWYKLETNGVSVKGELMLAVWIGTQADEAFTEAWHSDAVGVSGEGIVTTKSKVYMSPKLWYLRVNVIQVQDLETKDKNKGPPPDVFVRAVYGDVTKMTKLSPNRNNNPFWNEDLLFVVAEPFESQMVLTVEGKGGDKGGNKEEFIGKCSIPLGTLERRIADKTVDPRWYGLTGPVVKTDEGESAKVLTSKIQVRASLDGGYHVLNETTQYSSDLQPTVRQLWKKGIGLLEVGILNAIGLPVMKKSEKGRTDAYCVAKYGNKWVRTRTVMDSTSPQWNEQYNWEVYDPCTVITVGVFDNCHLLNANEKTEDSRIGKIRIRLSTLETGKTYTFAYPLLVLQPQGLFKTGELQLAVRFSCRSLFNLMLVYGNPILPKMHYTHPLSLNQQVNLRTQAIQLLSSRLGRSEPPVRKEVVEYLLDYDSNLWCMRRTSANSQRIKLVFHSLDNICRWVEVICSWKMPWLTVLVHLLLIVLVFFPQLLLPSICMNLFVCGAWNYRTRPRNPPHMDPRLSCVAQGSAPQDLEEEFERLPTNCKNQETLKFRYNRLRFAAGHVQSILGDLASQLERFQSLLNWRDPRATALFIGFCFVAGFVFYVIPLRLMFGLMVPYILRHPTLRSKVPSAPANFFRRLPTRVDSLL